ncbi:hypothetical protein OH76DRAFT_1421083 [Lentinus brumalis]|uniref:Uncharacterized protein n=1 Tax=Lentinus brumalis TaxID=2498619 RepID=A0A371CXJ8_9APHY|nr:hypothetical protein OH76DRAFT_1421083 [Polyporus brumalis]
MSRIHVTRRVLLHEDHDTTVCDAELSLLKKMDKGKQGDASSLPKKPRGVRIYVAPSFPEWQDQRAQIVKEAYSEEHDKVDDQKVRELLTLTKDNLRAMSFVQSVQAQEAHDAVWCAHRVSPHHALSEVKVLHEILPYLKRTLNLADAEVLSVEEAKSKDLSVLTKALVESAELFIAL